jgi:hypothetical protein
MKKFETNIIILVNSFWVGMNSNELKLMSKHQLFCNFCYICLCGATLMACESWKVMVVE